MKPVGLVEIVPIREVACSETKQNEAP
jgi:hypothetical protein